jgi:FkbM family methyltransferase
VDESSATIYKNNDFWSLSKSEVFDAISEKYQPKIVIDVGANVGFMTVLFSKKFKDAAIFSIEPNVNLIPIIESNLKDNDIKNVQIINKIVGSECKTSKTFQVNNVLSVDSRVNGLKGNYSVLDVEQTSIDNLLEIHGIRLEDSVFLKIDTQGFEKQVLEGAINLLNNFQRYCIVMEFAPFWLEESGTDAADFIKYLCANYSVCEIPNHSSFFSENLETIQSKLLKEGDANNFVGYVKNLSRNQKGWCDLMIFKK